MKPPGNAIEEWWWRSKRANKMEFSHLAIASGQSLRRDREGRERVR